MNKISRAYVYEKDKPRIANLQYINGQPPKLTEPDIIKFLLDYYNDNQLIKQSKKSTT